MFIAPLQQRYKNTQRFKRDERSAPMRSGSAAIADVEAQLLQSSLMELHGTSLPLGRCLAACIL